jgi:hypothetical protein
MPSFQSPVTNLQLPMKPYLITTGTVFGLIVIAHIWRVFLEPRLATDPWYILLTIAAAALSGWAWRLLRRLPRP